MDRYVVSFFIFTYSIRDCIFLTQYYKACYVVFWYPLIISDFWEFLFNKISFLLFDRSLRYEIEFGGIARGQFGLLSQNCQTFCFIDALLLGDFHAGF